MITGYISVKIQTSSIIIVFSMSEILQEIKSPCMVPVFSFSKKQHSISPNLAMTTCLISAFFLGTSAAQAIAAHDLAEQCPNVVTEPVSLPDPTTIQHLLGESAVTSGRGKGKISRQKNYDLAK